MFCFVVVCVLVLWGGLFFLCVFYVLQVLTTILWPRLHWGMGGGGVYFNGPVYFIAETVNEIRRQKIPNNKKMKVTTKTATTPTTIRTTTTTIIVIKTFFTIILIIWLGFQGHQERYVAPW